MRFTAVLSCLLFLAATTTAQAHLPIPFKKSFTQKQKRFAVWYNMRHVCKSHTRGCRWLRRWYAQLHRPKYYIPHRNAWLCIHRYEGSWTDAGDPFWGGLQMDRQFMQTYAPRWLLRKGFANTWTPVQQMMVAERAWRTRGFYPWPNTARMCGLL